MFIQYLGLAGLKPRAALSVVWCGGSYGQPGVLAISVHQEPINLQFHMLATVHWDPDVKRHKRVPSANSPSYHSPPSTPNFSSLEQSYLFSGILSFLCSFHFWDS